MTRSIGSYGKAQVFEHFFGSEVAAMGTTRLPVCGNGVNYSCTLEGTFAPTEDEPGGVLAATTNAGDDSSIAYTIGKFKPVDAGCWMEARFKADSVLLTAMWAGFAETVDATTPVMPDEYAVATLAVGAGGHAGFLYDPDATTDRWLCCAADGAIAAAGSPLECGAQTAVADQYDVVRVEIDQVGTAQCWLAVKDGALKLWKTWKTCVNPEDTFFALVMFENRSAVARCPEIDYFNAGGFVDWER